MSLWRLKVGSQWMASSRKMINQRWGFKQFIQSILDSEGGIRLDSMPRLSETNLPASIEDYCQTWSKVLGWNRDVSNIPIKQQTFPWLLLVDRLLVGCWYRGLCSLYNSVKCTTNVCKDGTIKEMRREQHPVQNICICGLMTTWRRQKGNKKDSLTDKGECTLISVRRFNIEIRWESKANPEQTQEGR